jgi:pimeloyl-ACP methyl ester carboxylesterase
MIRLITTLIITLLVFITSTFSQNTAITGDWYGQLEYLGKKSTIDFHVSKKDSIYKTTLSGASKQEMPTTFTKVNNTIIEITIDKIKASFIGELKGEIIDGVFKQVGMEFPLKLTRNKVVVKKIIRLQEPKKPYNYISEEVTFVNKKANNIKLAGTLTLPKNVKNPAVAILITGSGPQNRNSEILGHKPFLVLSDYLTRNGIAVLRYDDRGVADSEGTQKGKTSADFATDVEAAITYLKTRKDINTKKIGLIGHSEGGFIAPMIASKNKDVAFIVLLAGTGVDGGLILRTQERRANELNGVAKDALDYNERLGKKMHDIVNLSNNSNEVPENLKTFFTDFRKNNTEIYTNYITDDMVNMMVNVYNNWRIYFIKTDPAQFLEKTTCPVLALNGSKDFQVLPKLNLNGIKNALKHNKDVTTIELEGLNHLFQKCRTGALSEYAQLEETFNEDAMKIITNWINKRF